jgi:hypothetical protein
MSTRLGILALLVGLLALPATPVAAANPDDPGPFDAILVMSEAELQALLGANLLERYAVIPPADLGWDEAVLGDLGRLADEPVLTPRLLGRAAWDQILVPGGAAGLGQVVAGTAVVPGGPRGPVIVRPFRPPFPPVFPFPPPVRIAVVPVPVAVPPVVLAAPPPLPPPPPFPPQPVGPPLARAPGSGVPIIPEADTAALVVGGLAAVGAFAGLRRFRHRPN